MADNSLPNAAALLNASGLTPPRWEWRRANGVEKDLDAVRNAIVSPWSNGQTEGQITRLKLIKRQMYGRAKLDLLQARLVGAT